MYLTIFEQVTGVRVSFPLDASEESPPFRIGQTDGSLTQVSPGVAARYLVLGFEHILPEGLDHILFVLGLFPQLLAGLINPLVTQWAAQLP